MSVLEEYYGNPPEKTIYGLKVSEIADIAKAIVEDRLRVFPCKVGDTVYTTINPRNKIEPIKVHGWRYSEHDFAWVMLTSEMFNLKHSCVPHCSISAFGKTVFITREAAEEALRGKTEK